MHFAPLETSHRERLEEILVATGAFAEEEIAVALELFDLRGADYEFLGLHDAKDGLMGYACFGPTPSTDGTYDLYWLAVHPEAQGHGAGRRLVREVESQLAQRGARLLVAETSSRADYARTREFYLRAGYAETGRVRDFYAPADDRIIYTTRLAAREVGAATP